MFDWVADNYLNPAPEAVIRPLLRQIVDGTRVRLLAKCLDFHGNVVHAGLEVTGHVGYRAWNRLHNWVEVGG